ncbi:hypothetical protein PR048_012684 [Dryococelus australis]|uniref:Tc1-like transposase DDE domain-containing protein n=1 Tax=Dryococelus australis TaxID=614101 RepID=A0ABQ9HQ23_9NEOP|nr:hypothetical protein PR048_012684 [Dryococelus australis]
MSFQPRLSPHDPRQTRRHFSRVKIRLPPLMPYVVEHAMARGTVLPPHVACMPFSTCLILVGRSTIYSSLHPTTPDKLGVISAESRYVFHLSCHTWWNMPWQEYSLGPIIHLEDTLDRFGYESILGDHVYLYMMTVFPREDGIFQHGNAPCHSAKSVRTFLEEKDHDFKILPWPTNSPDLKPIEHLWDHLDRRVHHIWAALNIEVLGAAEDEARRVSNSGRNARKREIPEEACTIPTSKNPGTTSPAQQRPILWDLKVQRYAKLSERSAVKTTGTGPRKVTKAWDDHHFVCKAVMDFTVSSTVLARYWSNATGVHLSASTIRCCLLRAGLVAHMSLHRLPLSRNQKRLRLYWAHERRRCSAAEWQDVVFSDEYRINQLRLFFQCLN